MQMTQEKLPAAVYWRRRMLAGALLLALPFSGWAVVVASTGEPVRVFSGAADTGGSGVLIAGGMVPSWGQEAGAAGKEGATSASGPGSGATGLADGRADRETDTPDPKVAGPGAAVVVPTKGVPEAGATTTSVPAPGVAKPGGPGAAGPDARQGDDAATGGPGDDGATASPEESTPTAPAERNSPGGPTAAGDGDHARSAPSESVFRRWWRSLGEWWMHR